MSQSAHKAVRGLLILPATFSMVLMSPISMEIKAQDTTATCPCFSYEEVESIFLIGKQLELEGGSGGCDAEDYKVECKANVIVWNQNFDLIGEARVDWFDYDPGSCTYINNASDPPVERSVRWPHPAPEDIARACFDIIASVIAKSDTSEKCLTYP